MPPPIHRPRAASRRRLGASLATLPTLAGCMGLTDPPLPDGTRALAPPSVYATWWAMTEACSGITGPMSAVRWFVVPGGARIPPQGGEQVAGYWSPGSNQIVLAEGAVLDGPTVRHEMLHALIGRHFRRHRHTRRDFLERCGGVVGCQGSCLREAGPPAVPTAATPRVAPSALELDVAVAPTRPTRSTDDGHFTVVVTVRNPAAHRVVVLLPPHPFRAEPDSYGLRLMGPAGGLQLGEIGFDPGLPYFAAGEVKRHVFDLVLGDSLRHGLLPPGAYRLEGVFGGHARAVEDVSLDP